MKTSQHQAHIMKRVSHNNCPECRADNERSFVRSRPFRYDRVNEYLAYVQPRLAQIRDGAIDAAKAQGNYSPLWWYRDFVTALNHRISSHLPRQGRKYCDSYLERLNGMRFKGSKADASYLRQFACRGASCL